MKTKTKNETVEAVQSEVVPTTTETKVEENVQKTEVTDSTIPAKAMALLKTFAYLESAYINEKGGVFDTDTPENVRGKAVLYKNPFFNLK